MSVKTCKHLVKTCPNRHLN